MTSEQRTHETSHKSDVEIEIYKRIDERASSGAVLALPEITINQTLARYDGDTLGTASALELTQALLPELASDGSMDEYDIAVIDRLVEALEASDLAGIPYELLAQTLGVELDNGSLLGLANITELITSADTRKDAIEALRAEFSQFQIAEAEVRERFEADSGYELELEEDFDEDPEDNSSDNTVVSDNGEEFEF